MKQIYICQYTGKQFENQWDCQKSEFFNGDGHKRFMQVAKKFVDTIEKKFKIEVHRETLNIQDYLHERFDICLDHYRSIKFDFSINGNRKEYFKESDPVGDGRWEWDCKDEVKDLVRDFEKTHLLKLRKKFEGQLKYEWNDYKGAVYSLGNQKMDDILAVLSSKCRNKRIRIEILDK